MQDAADEKMKETDEATTEFEKQMSKIHSDMLILKWMAAIVLAGVICLLIESFFPA